MWPDIQFLLYMGGPAVLAAASIWILSSLANPKTKQTKKPKKIPKHRGKNFFLERSGMLDIGTPYLRSWRTSNVTYYDEEYEYETPNSELQASLFRGWYNIAMLLCVSYIFLHFWSNYNAVGTLIQNTAWAWSLILKIHELAFLILFVYFMSFSVFFLQYFASLFSVPLLDELNDINNYKMNKSKIESMNKHVLWIRLLSTFLSYFLTIGLLAGASLICYYKLHYWSYTQKVGLLFETICITCKMHSYVDINDSLFQNKVKWFRKLIKRSNKTSKKNEYETDPEDDIISINDVDGLNENELISYLVAYGLNKSLLTKTSTEQQKKLFITIRDQLLLKKTIYPDNIKLWDYILFSCSPTLCYSPIYPRTKHGTSMLAESTDLVSNISWIYFIEKCVMAVGLIVCMFLIVESFMIPVLKERDVSFVDSVIRLYFPSLCIFILGFFLVFDCILNAAAEIVCFADRKFYDDWWNASNFMEFSRKWNAPVHEYLLRHIYVKMFRKRIKCSPFMAKTFTFVYSIILHELVLTATTHQFKPWFTFFSLFQIPMMPVMESPMFKRTQLGNIITLACCILGSVWMLVLYARDYVILMENM